MSDLFFLNKKKSYAVKQEIKEGVIIDPAKVEYTGIEIVKKNSAKYTQDLLKDMIENIILNSNIKIEDKLTELTNIVTKHFNKFKDYISKYNFNDISKPCKWNKTQNIIESMKIYNHITGTETFNYGSAGRYIYVIFHDLKLFKDLKDVDFKKTDMLSIPLKYDINLLKEKMNQFKITINEDKQYNTIFNTTCESIIQVIKNIVNKQKKVIN